MNRFRDWLDQMRQGRNGMDTLAKTCVFAAIILLIISMFFRTNQRVSSILTILGALSLIYGYFRMFSRNVEKRWAEEKKFRAFLSKFTKPFKNAKRSAADKEHAYFSCPNCGQTVRVPKGRGKISIHCPKCQRDFIKRT